MVDQKFAVAIHIMTLLAYEKCEAGRLLTSEQVAKSVRTNPAVVRRLIAKLVDAELLESFKGKNGGVQLAKCPTKISLREIYDAVLEKTLLTARPTKGHATCPTSRSMGKLMKSVVEGFETHSKLYLSRITLDQLASKVEL